MKKLFSLGISLLTLANISSLSAYTWKITNGLDEKVCVTLNVSGQRMRRSIEPGQEASFDFSGWKAGLCLTSISVKEFKEGCPKGLKNIGKTSLFDLGKTEFDQLKNAAKTAAQEGYKAYKAKKTTKAAKTTKNANQKNQSTKTAANQSKTTEKKANAKKNNNLSKAIQSAIKSAVALVGKLCRSRSFVIVDKNGEIYAFSQKEK